MRRTRFCVAAVLAALLVLPLGAIAAEADKAAEAFEAVYGADWKRVKATPDFKDDLELATRLFAAAKETTGQPEFLAVLCTKAHELAGVHPNGCPTAVAAMELMGASVPARRVWCAERVVEIRQRQFDAVHTGDRATPGEELIAALLALADLKSGAPAEGAALCRKAEIVARTVSLDGKRVLGWTGPHVVLTRPGDWGLPRHQCLGMGTWCSNVVFHTAKLKMLSGKAKLLGPKR